MSRKLEERLSMLSENMENVETPPYTPLNQTARDKNDNI